jgi:hypothetical protein
MHLRLQQALVASVVTYGDAERIQRDLTTKPMGAPPQT